jgi:CRP/FNR family transcriptional regulator
MQSKVWYLKQFTLFNDLSSQEVEDLAKFLEEKNVRKKQIVFEPEDRDKVFFIKSGMVEVYYISEEGKKVILDTLKPKSFFAAVGFGEEGNHFLEATEDTLLCVTTKDQLFEMVTDEPRLLRKLVEKLFTQLFEARERVAVLASASIRDRLRHLLGRLAREYGVKKGEKVKIGSRFTHEDLANMIGSSRETVTKMLSVLKKEGVVESEKGYLVVDLKRLTGDS